MGRKKEQRHPFRTWLYPSLALAAFLGLLWQVYFQKTPVGIFPQAPITIVVHSKPGSGVDLMARKIALLARDYCDQPLVVENRSGTQGLAAMQHVMEEKADGYTLLAVTRSFLSTLLVNHTRIHLADFHFLAVVQEDPEALIINRNAPVHDFPTLLAGLREGSQGGGQVWIGPGVGGRDHLMALKTWQVLGARGRWLDYKSGPQAVLGILRQEAPVYVGNAQDITGKPDLALAVLAADRPLQGFEDVPTFQSLGYDLNESMWRGIAIKAGAPVQVTDFLTQLLAQVTADPRWAEFCRESLSLPQFLAGPALQQRLENEQKETRFFLEQAGLLHQFLKPAHTGRMAGLLALALFLPFLVLRWRRRKPFPRDLGPALVFLWLALFMGWQSTLFQVPSGTQATSPALVPRLWIVSLLGCGIWLVLRNLLQPDSPELVVLPGRFRVLILAPTLVIYFLAIPRLGYPVPTFLLVGGLMWLLGFRKIPALTAGAASFVVAAWLVFDWLLRIDLPTGSWFS